MRDDVIAAVRAVPAGFVTTFDQIGALLDVMPRHVADILAGLDARERDEVPWHRVVSLTGHLAPQMAASIAEQRARLAREGVSCDDAGRIDDFLGRLTTILAVTRKRVGENDPD